MYCNVHMGGVPFGSKTRIKHALDKTAGNYNQFIKTPTKIKIANLELALFINLPSTQRKWTIK